jgi:uncharacterized protein (TIGR02145 family)
MKQKQKIKLLPFSLAGGIPLLRGAGVCFLLLIGSMGFSHNIGINDTGTAADASAIFDLSATNTGFLIMRADTASIASPAFGLMTLAPTDSCLYISGCIATAATVVVDITSSTGAIWMDRNLGASQVATSSKDAAAYGNLYQWGRAADGHEDRGSAVTATKSTTDTPGHSSFINEPNFPFRWRTPQNDNLWQGVAGINNPCPTGYRIPTSAELDLERATDFTSNNAPGAFGGVLKLTVVGYRIFSNASLNNVGSSGYYWSSTVNGTNANYLSFSSSNASINNNTRAYGFSVRCIKD